MSANDNLKYLKMARELLGPCDIETLVEAAARIREFDTEQYSLPVVSTRQDIMSFVRDCKISHPLKGYIPFTAYAYQQDVLEKLANPDTQIAIINASRMLGMTTTLGLYALYQATTKNNQTILIASHSTEYTREIMWRIRESLIHMPNALARQEENKGLLRFVNGSRIQVIPLTTEHIGGLHKSFTHLLIDNAAFISYKTLWDCWRAAMPAVNNGAQIVLQSSPRWNEGPFFELWNRVETMAAVGIKLTWKDHPDRDEKWADSMRANLGAKDFAMEHEGQFVSRIF